MLFAAGMGIGLVFWGAAEPISHFSKPPEGLAPESMDAARAAMRYVFFHWGLHPWAIYALIGLAMAWFQFNRNGRGQISDMLQPIIGRHHRGWIGHMVNISAVVATAVGVATALGFGTVQIAAGVERVFGAGGRAAAADHHRSGFRTVHGVHAQRRRPRHEMAVQLQPCIGCTARAGAGTRPDWRDLQHLHDDVGLLSQSAGDDEPAHVTVLVQHLGRGLDDLLLGLVDLLGTVRGFVHRAHLARAQRASS